MSVKILDGRAKKPVRSVPARKTKGILNEDSFRKTLTGIICFHRFAIYAYSALSFLYGRAYQFLKNCDKPSVKQYKRIAKLQMIGLVIIGIVGYCIKLFHIPINRMITEA